MHRMTWGCDAQMRMMLPLMDLFNHANADVANIAMFRDDSGDYVGYAKRDIRKGEQARMHQAAFLLWTPGMQRCIMRISLSARTCASAACLLVRMHGRQWSLEMPNEGALEAHACNKL